MKINLNKTLNVVLVTLFSISSLSILSGFMIFKKRVVIDNRITVYNSANLDYNQLSNSVSILLADSPFKSQSSTKVFIVPRWFLILVNPISGWNAQGFNISYLNFQYINQDSLAEGSQRTLAGTIAHETTHVDLLNRYGFKTLIMGFTDTWKIEGICDMVSKELSIPQIQWNSIIARYNIGNTLNQREKYVIYHLQVRDVLKTGMTMPQLIEKNINPPVLKAL